MNLVQRIDYLVYCIIVLGHGYALHLTTQALLCLVDLGPPGVYTRLPPFVLRIFWPNVRPE